MRTIHVALVWALLGALAGAAAADPATAKQHNNAGMKRYAKRDYAGAQALFEKAIAEDPSFVKAHYNRASMAALQLDLEVMIEELTWLAGSKDPDATRVLTKAKTDADFRLVSLVDEARAALGLRPVADTPLEQLLLAYGGWWSGVDEGMMQGWLELRFLPKGKVTGRDHSGETGSWYPWSGTWKVKDRTVIIKIGKATTTYGLVSCGDRTVEGAFCLVREDEGAWVSPARAP